MAKRPTLSDESFLGHLFGPKKHALPTGIRKTTLKGSKGQRKARVAAFNRMTPFKQELLKRAGKRDAYLRGEATLADAKNALRPIGIEKGVARPLRAKPFKPILETPLDRKIATYIITTLRGRDDLKKPLNPKTVIEQNVYLGANADEGMLRWTARDMKHAARNGSEYEYVDEAGNTHNPFWYH